MERLFDASPQVDRLENRSHWAHPLWLRHSLPHSFITSACDISLTVHDLSIDNCFLTWLLCSFTYRAKSDGLRATFGVWLLPFAVSPLLPGTSISISLPLHLPQQCFAGSTLRLCRFITTLQFKAVHACYIHQRDSSVSVRTKVIAIIVVGFRLTQANLYAIW